VYIYILLQIVGFREVLLRFTSLEREGDDLNENLWVLDPASVSQFISALTEVLEYYKNYCRYFDCSEFLGLDANIVVSQLRKEIICIIGALGASNIFSVSSDSFPHKFGTSHDRICSVLSLLMLAICKATCCTPAKEKFKNYSSGYHSAPTVCCGTDLQRILC
jgi:hypothetical protein